MRRRILTLTVGLTTVVILAFAVPLAFLVFRSVESTALDTARAEAQAVAAFISGGPPEGVIAQRLSHERDEHGLAIWVRTPTDTILGNQPAGVSVSALSDPDADGDGHLGDVSLGGVDDLSNGSVTAVYTSTTAGRWTVYTYLTEGELHSGLTLRWSILSGVTVALLAASVVAGEFLAQRLARPLENAAATAHRLAAGDTEARASTEGPREVAEVGAALNVLADRIDEVIATERESVADLSHRLRTPLTALRLDVDALRDPAESGRLSGHVTSLERSLTAVINAARRPTREGRIPGCDATAVVRSRVDFWAPLVVDQARRTDLDIAEDLPRVRLSADDLATAVDALIENVIAHTDEGTAFAVSVRSETADDRPMVVVSVADEGPGLAPGVGVRGRSDRGSTGLGLDIARRAAEASGGHLRLDRAVESGAVVALWLATSPPLPIPPESQAQHSTT